MSDTIPDTSAQTGSTFLFSFCRQGFLKYDSASQVKDAFQIADSWSDCKVRGEFDTLQVIDDLYVPTTKGNTTAIPEPITFSYPEYGKGGEHQLRVDKVIKFTNVDFIGD